MKVLVCGSRDWKKISPIERELAKLPQGTIIVHGAARGADSIADTIARRLGFEVRPYPVTKEEWETLGLAAGPIRNSRMLTEEHLPNEPIDLVLAFSDDFAASRGTRDMIRKSRAAKIAVEPFSI